jgi:translation initiation factor 3 subunit F
LAQKSGLSDVEVHPLVLFNILDHFIRRNEGQERVIGTLLGVPSGPYSVTITNSFPVPHSEGDQVTSPPAHPATPGAHSAPLPPRV